MKLIKEIFKKNASESKQAAKIYLFLYKFASVFFTYFHDYMKFCEKCQLWFVNSFTY